MVKTRLAIMIWDMLLEMLCKTFFYFLLLLWIIDLILTPFNPNRKRKRNYDDDLPGLGSLYSPLTYDPKTGRITSAFGEKVREKAVEEERERQQ